LVSTAVRARWPFVLRQGIASLYRPGNQTRAVALALGFGVFLMSSLYQVQVNLLRQFGGRLAASPANVVFFDIQDDQQAGVDSLVRRQGHTVIQAAPIVPMRIAQINGRPASELLADSGGSRRAGWALRREYRSTFRDTLVPSERLIAGSWFGANAGANGLHEASFEEEVARELRVRLGDTVTWNVQGVTVRTRVSSLREVNWARFEPNFFVVTNSAALAAAPKQFVILANVNGACRDEVSGLKEVGPAALPIRPIPCSGFRIALPPSCLMKRRISVASRVIRVRGRTGTGSDRESVAPRERARAALAKERIERSGSALASCQVFEQQLGNDADYGQPAGVLADLKHVAHAGYEYPLADGILLGPEQPCERFVDDDGTPPRRMFERFR
jgi:hypothetical protein